MGNVYPLRPLCSDFPISNAYRLDNVFEQELEKKLYDTLKAAPELNNGNKNLCRISKYKIARGGSHIKTPKAIANKATNKSNADRLIE
ncbi:2289_t:CDS:2, partial [Entrophospora sp. SA101]